MDLNGLLTMNDDGQFELENETGIINISDLLDNIFESGLKPQVYVRIMKDGKLIFEESGGLFLNVDEQRVESFFVCGLNLSKTLFYSTDEYLDITIRQQKGTNKVYGNVS